MRNAVIFIAIVVSFILFMVTRGADESERKAQKDILLTCQDEVYYLDTVKDILASQVAGKLLRAGDYKLSGEIVESSYKSQIKKYIQKDSAHSGFKKIIDEFKKEGYTTSDSNALSIQYSIIENNVAEPITRYKKTYKLVGYLEFKFLLDGTIVYEAKTDYIGRMGEDIPRRVKCILNSFNSI